MDKLQQLEDILKGYKKVAIAYSGGCDSNFLLAVAIKTLGKENVLAVLCQGAMMSQEDQQEAMSLLENTPSCIIPVDVFAVKEFQYNDKQRCYFCKKTIMSKVIEAAHVHGFEYVLDGKNKDDEGVYRPGIKACEELGILSPLAMSQMTKKEIRDYSQKLGIVTYNKPANACLASRFDYDTELTLEKLQRVDQAESLLHALGIYHVRVRVQEQLARIEVEPKDFMQVMNHLEIVEKIKELGFRYVTLDLEGIRSGGYDHENKRGS